MNPSPLITYECEVCGATFTSELGLRAHDSVCIPKNMPGKQEYLRNDFSIDQSMSLIFKNGFILDTHIRMWNNGI